MLRWSAVLAAACLAGCNAYDEGKLAGVSEGCQPGDLGCVPGRPAASTSSTSDSQTVSFALRGITLDQSENDAWRHTGLNLDHAVTSGANPVTSCTAASGASVSIDGEAGIDNVFGSVLVPELILQLFGTLETDLCCFMQRGRGTLILRVDSWNGERNDAQVGISLISALDGTTDAPGDVAWDNSADVHQLKQVASGDSASLPSWDPDSTSWYASRGDFQLGSEGDFQAVKQRDITGYIRDGYLVMSLNSSQPVSLYLADTAGIRIPLLGGVLMARISADGKYLESGLLGGRMSGDGLLEANVSLLASNINGQPNPTARMTACNNFTAMVSTLVQQYADTTSSLKDDDPTSTCDAVSVGLSFAGVRARSVELSGEALCIPKGDCVNFGPGIDCAPIAETVSNTCGSGLGLGCDLATWNPAPSSGADAGVDAGP